MGNATYCEQQRDRDAGLEVEDTEEGGDWTKDQCHMQSCTKRNA